MHSVCYTQHIFVYFLSTLLLERQRKHVKWYSPESFRFDEVSGLAGPYGIRQYMDTSYRTTKDQQKILRVTREKRQITSNRTTTLRWRERRRQGNGIFRVPRGVTVDLDVYIQTTVIHELEWNRLSGKSWVLTAIGPMPAQNKAVAQEKGI